MVGIEGTGTETFEYFKATFQLTNNPFPNRFYRNLYQYVLEIDTVNLLRAVMKISSALNNLDELIYNKKYRFCSKLARFIFVCIMTKNRGSTAVSVLPQPGARRMHPRPPPRLSR